jgi:hydrogenase assembly chaperone HypC/HupF
VRRDVDVTLVDVVAGKYVLVHMGYVIQVIEKEDARETIDYWREILDAFDQDPKDKPRA